MSLLTKYNSFALFSTAIPHSFSLYYCRHTQRQQKHAHIHIIYTQYTHTYISGCGNIFRFKFPRYEQRERETNTAQNIQTVSVEQLKQTNKQHQQQNCAAESNVYTHKITSILFRFRQKVCKVLPSLNESDCVMKICMRLQSNGQMVFVANAISVSASK